LAQNLLPLSTDELKGGSRLIQILVVDPFDQDRSQLTNTLNKLGFSVVEAADAKQASALLSQSAPDLVILDESVKGLTPEQMMAEFDGRQMDSFLLVTSRQPVLERGMEYIRRGVFSYLEKPVPPAILERFISSGLENKQAYRYVVDMAQELKQANEALETEKATLNRRTEQLRFLNDLGVKLSATLNCAEITTVVTEVLENLAAPDMVVLLTNFNPDNPPRLMTQHHLTKALADRMADELLRELDIQNHASPIVLTVSPKDKKRLRNRKPQYCHTLPLTAAGNICGIVGLYYSQPPQIDSDLYMLLGSVALQSAQALFNAHQHESALQLAAHDALTGLLNRRAFDQALEREYGRAMRYKTDLSLIILDLDHFKSVNDRYGHKAGDFVLQKVAHLMDHCVRSTDVVARLGGEEFAILLPNTDQGMALQLADRIQETLRQNVLHLGDALHVQTVSQGLADTRHPEVADAEDLVRLADRALYQAKDEGRNTICRAVALELPGQKKDRAYAR
jgi:diguanylate cyclase (GGDEF)-like protein